MVGTRPCDQGSESFEIIIKCLFKLNRNSSKSVNKFINFKLCYIW